MRPIWVSGNNRDGEEYSNKNALPEVATEDASRCMPKDAEPDKVGNHRTGDGDDEAVGSSFCFEGAFCMDDVLKR